MSNAVKLTPRQEAFAGEVAKIELARGAGQKATQGEAAIRAGYAPSGADSNASKLTNNNKLRERIEQIKKEGIKKADLTTDMLVADLAGIALKDTTPENARVAAHKLLLQVNGDLVQKTEDVTQTMTDAELIDKKAHADAATYGIPLEQAREAIKRELESTE